MADYVLYYTLVALWQIFGTQGAFGIPIKSLKMG
jgi:hypothetical protein